MKKIFYTSQIRAIFLLLGLAIVAATNDDNTIQEGTLRQRRKIYEVGALQTKYEQLPNNMYEDMEHPARKRKAVTTINSERTSEDITRRVNEDLNRETGWNFDRYLQDMINFDMSLSFSMSFSMSMSMP
jgi:hypothetical protein